MTVEEFFAAYSPKVEAIGLDLRRQVQALLPDAEEILFEGWKNVSYGDRQGRSDKHLLLYIAPFKDSVNLGFCRGANLPDEARLLKGSGKLMRHLKLKSKTDYTPAQIATLILEA